MSSRLDVLPPEITNELEGLQDEVPAGAVPGDPRARRGRAGRAARAGVRVGRRDAGRRGIPRAGAPRAARAARRRRHRARRASCSRCSGPASTRSSTSTSRRCAGSAAGSATCASSPTASTRPRSSRSSRGTSLEEIDYLHEAANSERFAADFAGDDRVRRARRSSGSARPAACSRSRTSRRSRSPTPRRCARRASTRPRSRRCSRRSCSTSCSRNGFFHADPHPGNIFVTPRRRMRPGERPWKLTFIDFGMMGEVPASTRSGLRKLLIAAASRDGKGLVDAIRDVGVLLPVRRHHRARAGDDAALRPVRRHGLRRAARGRPARVPRLRGRSSATWCGRCRSSCPRTSCSSSARCRSPPACAARSIPTFNLWDSVEPYAAQLHPRRARQRRAGPRAAGARDRRHRRAAARSGWTRSSPASRTARSRSRRPRLERRVARLERTARRRRLGAAVRRPAHRRCRAARRRTVLGTVLMVASVLPLLHALFAGRGGR